MYIPEWSFITVLSICLKIPKHSTKSFQHRKTDKPILGNIKSNCCTVLEYVRLPPSIGTNAIPRDNLMSSSHSKDLNLHCAVQLVLCRWETWPKPFNCFPRQQLREETRELMEKRQLPSIDLYMLNSERKSKW